MATRKTAAGPGAGGTAKRPSARERIEAAREARRRRRRVILAAASGGVAVVVGGSVAVAVAAGGQGSGHHHSPAARAAWPRPADTADRARAIGLSVAPMEGTALHFHTHLDILVDDRPVSVPAGLGIATSGQEMAELHTHDTTGILHVEAPTTGKRYVLGQLFTEWGLRLDATDLGGLKTGGGRTLTAYVDGRRQSGDPANIELAPHREIALVYGPASSRPKVASSYAFPSGL
jgi:hypothetical protein